MTDSLLRQANYVLDACGRQVPPKGQNYVDIPAHIGYNRFMPGSSVGTYPGSENIGAVMHKGRVSFFLRSVTAQSLPRATQGVYWRLRFGDGKYFQSNLTSHSMAFGFGSDRQSFSPEVEWKAGDKLYVDLDTILAGPPPTDGYTVSMMFEGVYRFPISGSGSVAHPFSDDLPRYFQTPNQNILAPEFSSGPGCPNPTPAGFSDEEYWYVSPTVNLPTDGASISNVGTQIETQSDFIIREIWPNFPGGANQGTGNVVFRMRRGDGYVVMSNFCPINSLLGPVFKELRMRAGDTLYFDAYVVDGGGAPFSVLTFGLYLYGVKRRRAF